MSNAQQQKPASRWQLRETELRFSKIPLLMGIVNITPDSFSDGGRFFDPDQAVNHALNLQSQGAAILDVGGESTRPYSTPVEETEELRRVVAVVGRLSREARLPISIDTTKPAVADAALKAGAEIINDVSGFRDPQMVAVAVRHGAGVCVMHMQGTPQDMQNQPDYKDVVEEIHVYLAQQRDMLLECGVRADRICLDPGIGFGKSHDHNLELIRGAARFHDLGCPVLVGHSRKGFIGKVVQDQDVDRDAGTIAVALRLAQNQVSVIRVHDVAAVRQALLLFDACAPDVHYR
jgi:dihydropteroate synthase